MAHQYRISRECTEWAIGKQWTFSRFTRNIWEAFADYGKRRLPSPVRTALDVVAEVTLKDADIHRQLLAVDEAEVVKAKEEKRRPITVAGRFRPMADDLWTRALMLSNRYLHPGSSEMLGLIDSLEGGSYLFYLLLQKNHKDISEDVAFDIYSDLFMNSQATDAGEGDGRKTISDILDVCSGRAPDMSGPDPESMEKNSTAPAA